jgi:hypothetical protein
MSPIAGRIVRTSMGALVVAAGVSIGVYASRSVDLQLQQSDTVVPVAVEPQAPSPPVSGISTIPNEPAQPAPADPTQSSEPLASPQEPVAESPDPVPDLQIPAIETSAVRCAGPQPGANWICVEGEWILPGAPPAVDPYNLDDMAAASDLALLPGTGGGLGGPTAYRLPGAATCAFPQPHPAATCRNGTWVRPGSVNGNGRANGNANGNGNGNGYGDSNAWMYRGPGMPVSQTTYSPACRSAQPARNYRCHNGVWMQAVPGAATQTFYANDWTSVPGGPASANLEYKPVNEDYVVPAGACVAQSPGRNYVCVNGAWVIR